MNALTNPAKYALLSVLASLTVACAGTDRKPTNPGDPWEGFNRKSYAFNKTVDKAVILPVTNAYIAITPEPVQDGVSNFLSNLGEIGSFANHLMQSEIADALHTAGRFTFNSTLGLAGLFDPAAFVGVEKRSDNFDLTLAKWGVPQGPYLMLPFMGPSTLRGVTNIPANIQIRNSVDVGVSAYRTPLFVMGAIDARKRLKKFDAMLFGDEYALIRSAYLRRIAQQTGTSMSRQTPTQSQTGTNGDDFDDFDDFDADQDANQDDFESFN